MKNLSIFLKIYLVSVSILIGLCLLASLTFFIYSYKDVVSDLKYVNWFSPVWSPSRKVDSTNNFSLLWSKKVEGGSQHLAFTQLFAPDDKNLIYITTHSINSIDYLTGDLLWLTEFPEDTTFHFYDGRLYSLDSACKDNQSCTEKVFDIPAMCNVNLSHLNRLSTMRVYDAHTGNKVWEYSYRLVYSNQIFFNGKSMILEGVTWDLLNKYILNIEVNLDSGDVIKSDCENYNSYSRISDDDGILSSAFLPILSDDDWERNVETPAFIVKGSKLILVDRKTKHSSGEIVFSGFPLNAYDVKLIVKDGLLIVFLDDSNQFFVFQIK
jgi:hypothetical protein